MRHLSVRLAVAMIGMMILSLVIIAAMQQLAQYRAYWALPEEVRNDLPPPPFRLGRSFDRLLVVSPSPPPAVQQAPSEAANISEAGEVELGTVNLRLARNFQSFRQYQNESFLIGVALAALLSVALALLLSRMIAKPIERVSQAAAAVAEGDLSARVPMTGGQRRSSLETTRLSENFNRMAESLERYEGERKAMIADIAHELRTPLAAMQLRLEALLDELVPFERSEAERLHRQVLLLSRLVQDLRTLSLADAGKLSLERRDTDLIGLVRGVFDNYDERARHQEIELELQASSPTVQAYVDPDRVAQVIGNLLDNALRVTPAKGKVTATLCEDEERAVVTISDTGPGFSEETRAHLFNRFFQDKDTKGSSGLGLAIVHALVTLHGGQVRALNHAQGASFVVELPRRATST